MKKLVIQMEKQKMVYEEKALVALQKAMQEKTEALCKAETLQVKHLAFNPDNQGRRRMNVTDSFRFSGDRCPLLPHQKSQV